MRREFLLNIAFLVAVNLIIKPIFVFGIDLQVQNVVGAGAYGLYAALFSLAYMLQIISDAGIQQHNNQTIARDRSQLQARWPELTRLKWILSLVYIGVCMGAGILLGYGDVLLPLLLPVTLNQLLLSWLLYLRSNVSGLGLYRKDSLLSVLDKVWMLLICGVLLYHPVLRIHFRIEWFVWAQTVSFGVTIVVALYFLRHQSLNWRVRVDWQGIGNQLRQSLPFALVVLLMTGYYRMDTLLLEQLLPDGAEQAGIYYMAFRLLDVLNSFAYLFGALLLPMFSYQLGQREDIKPLVLSGAQLLFVGSVIVAVLLTRYAADCIPALYRDPSAEAVVALQWLAWAFVPIAMMHVFMALLAADRRLKAMNRVLFVTVVVNIGMLWYLIPRQGVAGAAMATLITQVVVSSAMILLATRRVRLRWTTRELMGFVVFLAGMLLLMWIPLPVGLPWWGEASLLTLAGGLWAMVLGVLPLAQFMVLLQRRAQS
jgi:O-antigen/teichoic acid export membrane protein